MTYLVDYKIDDVWHEIKLTGDSIEDIRKKRGEYLGVPKKYLTEKGCGT